MTPIARFAGFRRAALIGLALFGAVCHWPGAARAEVDIPFAPLQDETLHDPDNPTKVFRVDFARVEHEFPLSRADRMKITPAYLATLSQEQVDQIYARLTAGPIPDGPHQGTLFFARGDGMESRLDEILGGVAGRVPAAKLHALEVAGRTLLKGKMFYRDRGALRNSSKI